MALIRSSRFLLIVLAVLGTAVLACSSSDLIGQGVNNPTPTFVPFATATAGGRISVWLVTPPGGVNTNSGAVTATPFGSAVAPVETATAAFATFQAATATARATFIAPVFQPNDCPPPGNPLPPLRPASFSLYAQAIGLYLSAGGATTTLESTLRAWGALTDGHGVLQTDTDLTGDGVKDIIVDVLDPTYYRANAPSPGQLMIFGCAQKGYRLLFSTQFSSVSMLPELKRVGNMNGDGRAQIAFTQQLCAGGNCTQTMQILEWNSLTGAFAPLNDLPIDATNAKVTISDVDGDGILEVSLINSPPNDVNAGPPRHHTEVWDWNGVNYISSQLRWDAPIYRIHAVYDADFAFEQGDFRASLKLYDRARDDPYLQPWFDPNELTTLRGYSAFRKLVAYAALRSTSRATDMLNLLGTENPPGSPGEGWSMLGNAFMDAYKKFRSLKKVCAAAIDFLNARPDLLAAMNSYGYANHVYSLQEFCPF